MSSRVYKFTTGATTNLRKVGNLNTTVLGASLCNNSATVWLFVKFYWFKPTVAAVTPTVGTTVPDLTIGCPPAVVGGDPGQAVPSWPNGITQGGELWVSVTALQGDSDATAVGSGQGIISLIVE